MKKLLAFVLAAALVLSAVSVCFAALACTQELYLQGKLGEERCSGLLRVLPV